jgi:cell division protein FtsX
MVIAVVVLGVVLLVVSVRRLRRPGTVRRRWPFVTSAVLTGLVVGLIGGGALVALTVGRTTWNAWTAGSPQRESITLSLVMLGLPLLFALAGLFLLLGNLRHGRRNRRETNGAHQST